MSLRARIAQAADRIRTEGVQGLLRKGRTLGYPTDYLLCRVRGRRSRLIRDWRQLAYEASPIDHLASALYQGFVRERTLEGIWRALLLEHGWVCGQMDEATRRIFAPYFLYAELRTVFMSLRSLQSEKMQKAGEVLSVSLLAQDVKAVLREGEVTEAIAGLETLLTALSPDFAGLAAAYEHKGLREVEHILIHRYLSFVLAQQLNAAMRGFFVRVVDSRNILALYKALRTGLRGPGRFIDGGTIPVTRLTDLVETDDVREVAGLIRKATALAISSPEPTQVESALYRGITKFLRSEGRDPLGASLILDYLWRCQIEVMNLSLLLAGKDLERSEAAAELVG